MTILGRFFQGVVTSLSIAAFGLAAPAAAQTKSDGGLQFYAEARGGFSFMSDQTFRFARAGLSDATTKAKVGSSWMAGAALGVHLSDSIRLEAEYLYRRNTLKNVATPALTAPGNGDFNSVFIMGNAYYDFAGWQFSSVQVRPFIGLGLGWAQEIDIDLTGGGRTVNYSGSDFAYQAMAGVRLEYDSGWYSSVGIRYANASKARLTGTGGTLRANYAPISGIISIGYRF